MAQRGKSPATYDDLYAVPENMVAEILGGELHVSPRPALPHTHAASVLGAELGTPFHRGHDGPGGWWILDEPELHLGNDVVVPDLAAWRRERLPAIPPDPYLTVAPDWVCEVLSPATEHIDREKKLAIYAREGVSHVWLVNPLLRTLEALQLESGQWTLLATHEGTAEVRVVPFDAIVLELAAMWI